MKFRNYLLLCVLFFCFENINSQTPCSNPITPADGNDVLPGCTLSCDVLYNGSSSGYTPGPLSTPFPGAGFGCIITVENDQYFPFVAASNGCVNFTINAFNCTSGTSLQCIIMNADLSGDAYACESGIGILNVSTCALIPGNDYILIIDGTGGAICDFTIEKVVNDIQVTIDPQPPVCEDGVYTTLTANPTGGSWSGDVDGSGGFNPGVLGAGTYSAIYNYIHPSGCPGMDMINFVINPLPNISIAPVPSLCESGASVTLAATPPGGTWGGAVNSDIFDPVTSGLGTHTVSYTVTNSFGCTGEGTIDIEVLADPVITFLSPDKYCIDHGIVVLEAEPLGGIWSGDVNSIGEFDPESLGPGTYTAIYTYTDLMIGCSAVTAQQQITVFPLPVFSLGISNTGPFCENAGRQYIIANPPGGIWGGAAFSGGEIVPDLTGVGVHDVTYQHEETDANGCFFSADTVFQIEILAPPFAEIEPIDPLCPYDPSFQLTATPPGGVWGGVASIAGQINPTALGGGSHVATYTVTGSNSCVNEAAFSIEINEDPDIYFFNTGPFCLQNKIHGLEADPSGGDWGGAVHFDGSFNPRDLGVGIHSATYNYFYGSNCEKLDSVMFTVLSPDSLTFGDSIFCEHTGLQNLTAMPSGGTWSGGTWSGGMVSSSGQINTDTLSVGFYSVTYTVNQGGNCDITDSLEVEIRGIDVTVTGDTSFCTTAGIQTLVGTPDSGIWSGAADTLGNVDPSVLSVGTHTVSYTAISDFGCVKTAEQLIRITAPPTAVLSGSGTICPGGNASVDLTVDLTGTAPWQVNYELDSTAQVPITVSSSPFVLTASQSGTYTLTQVEDASGCRNTASGTATVTELVPLSITDTRSQCDGTNTSFIVSFEISGGDRTTYSVSGLTGSVSSAAPYIFTSDDIATGTPVSFTVSDDSGCASVSEMLTVDCSCETEVGTMDLTAIDICGAGTTTAVYDNTDEFLDGDDLVRYILHTNAGVSLGSVLATNTASVFDFDGLTMQYGTTYYISAVAGSNDGNDNVDLTDNCLKVAQGTPVTWHEDPTAILSGDASICPDSSASLMINLTGTAPWSVRYSDGTDTVELNGITNNPFSFDVSPLQNTNYSLTDVRDDNCSGTVSGTATLSLFSLPRVENLLTTCDINKTEYVVTFEIIGGDAATYAVSGGIGTLAGNTFTSEPIAAGSGYAFTITDGNNCTPVEISAADVQCNCETDAGTLQNNSFEACIGETVEAFHGSDEFLDSNDTLLFVLHDGSAGRLGDIIATGGSAVFGFDASQMTVEVEYFISAVAGNQNSAPGVDFNDGCLSVSDGVPVIFHELPTALLSSDETICEGEEATLILELTGSPPFNISLSNGNGSFDLTGITSGYEYKFTPSETTTISVLSISDANGCENTSTAEATVRVNTAPSAEVTPSSQICNTAQSGEVTVFDLSTLITGGDMTGSWENINGIGVGTLPILDFENTVPGDYAFRYTTASAQMPCEEVTYEIILTVRDCSCPSVVTAPAGPFCTDAADLDLTIVTVTTEPGSWVISNAPSGSTAEITGTDFRASGSAAGDYELTFTLDAPITGCPENSNQTVTLFAPPTAEVSPGAEVCNSDLLGDPTVFDLSTLITGGDMSGTWENVDNIGVGTLPILDFENTVPGDYTFRYTTASAQAPCSEVTYETTLTVRDCTCPSAATAPAGPFCNDAARLDLTTITVTTEPGTWTITNAPIGSTATVIGDIFNATNSAAGDYELTYRLTQNPPVGCDNSSSQIIQVSQAVSAGIASGVLRICNDGSALNLFEELTGATPGGIWTDISGTPAGSLFNNGILTTRNLPNGIYIFEYEIIAPAPCKGDSEQITVEIDNPVNAGTLIENLSFCEGSDTTINLFDMIENYDLGGTWTDISDVPTSGFNQNGTLLTNGLSNGIYRFRYALTPGGICPSDETAVEVRINENPTADAGETSELTCDIRTAVIGGTNSSTGQNITYLWSGSITIEDPTVAVTTVREAANYTLRVTDTASGCFEEEEVIITERSTLPTLSAGQVEITCFGSDDGEIEVERISGGVPPYLYSLNGGAFSQTNTFRNLTPGDYTLTVEDAEGCRDELTFTISQPEELTVTLTTNLGAGSNLIEQGDSIQLNADISAPFDSIHWSPPEAFEPCDPEVDPLGCINPWVAPERVTTYEVFAINEKGCSDRADITVFVKKVRNVYIPSAFSPNEDGINDEFGIYTDDSVEKIKRFLVFDRWGSPVFEYRDFEPDDPAGRWNGQFRNKTMNSAVFSFFAEIEFKDRTTEIFKGDVSLFR